MDYKQIIELAVALIAGYFSPLLVSLATQQNWPKVAKLACASAIAAVLALLTALLNLPLTMASWVAAFLVTFAAQRAAWDLELPIGGSPILNLRLLDIGSVVKTITGDGTGEALPPVDAAETGP